jgi:hypothetical protein
VSWTLSPRKLLAKKISQQRLAQIFVTVRLEVGSREELDREFPLSDQGKQERERTINNTSYKHGQAIETDFLGSESEKQERERERERSRNREQRREREGEGLDIGSREERERVP